MTTPDDDFDARFKKAVIVFAILEALVLVPVLIYVVLSGP